MTFSTDSGIKELGEEKREFIFSVWELLDCESVGAKEILAIEAAVKEKYGQSESFLPMRIARMLADEGAELRHSEIMELFIKRYPQSAKPSDLSHLFRFDTLKSALASIRELERQRKIFLAESDEAGIGQIRSRVAAIRQQLKESALSDHSFESAADLRREIADWLAVWLQTPEIFETWLAIRRGTTEFKEKFGKLL